MQILAVVDANAAANTVIECHVDVGSQLLASVGRVTIGC